MSVVKAKPWQILSVSSPVSFYYQLTLKTTGYHLLITDLKRGWKQEIDGTRQLLSAVQNVFNETQISELLNLIEILLKSPVQMQLCTSTMKLHATHSIGRIPFKMNFELMELSTSDVVHVLHEQWIHPLLILSLQHQHQLQALEKKLAIKDKEILYFKELMNELGIKNEKSCFIPLIYLINGIEFTPIFDSKQFHLESLRDDQPVASLDLLFRNETFIQEWAHVPEFKAIEINEQIHEQTHVKDEKVKKEMPSISEEIKQEAAPDIPIETQAEPSQPADDLKRRKEFETQLKQLKQKPKKKKLF